MLKVIGEGTGAFYQHYPRTAAVVTACKDGRKNAMAVAWHCPISFNPPLYGISISPKRYTYQLIKGSREFSINFMPIEKSELIAAVGGVSGANIDKFTEFNIREDSPIKTEAPILRDAYAVYECKVVEDSFIGDHAWIIGEIVAVHVAEDVFKESGVLDLSVIMPSLYLGADVYCSVSKDSLSYLEREKYGKK